MPRTVADVDVDLKALQAKRQEARAAHEWDYVLVLTAAINRALDERRAVDASSRRTGPGLARPGSSVAAAG